jgi:RsiW-degrading membrane proteinase PrsW (M82 family)
VRRESDWRTVILAVGATGGALLAFAVAALIVAYALLGSAQPQQLDGRRTAFDMVVLASALVVIGIAFLPAAYYSIQRLFGRPVPPATPKLLRVWQGILLVVVWLGTAAGAGYLFQNHVAKWITPAFYVLAIGVPAFFFARLATGGLRPGSRQRLWGALAAGFGLGIAPAMFAELILAVVGLVLVGVYVALHPEQLAALQSLANQLRNSSDMEQMLTQAAPWLTSPVVLAGAFLVFAVISPFIEEIAKSLTTWAVYDRLTSPAQGFAIGAMSGTAFGLVESLLVSSTPGGDWTTTLLVRGASTMMHIMSASLTGWGIASLRTKKSIGMLLGMYVLAMALHGAWNGSVVAITFGSVRSALVPGERDPIGIVFIALGVVALATLCIGIPLGMATINWRFRAAEVPVTTAPAAMWDRPDSPLDSRKPPSAHPELPDNSRYLDENSADTRPTSPPALPGPED